MATEVWIVSIVGGVIVAVTAIFILRGRLKSVRVKGPGGEMKIDTHPPSKTRPGDATMKGVEGRTVQNRSETGGAATMEDVKATEDVINISTDHPSTDVGSPQNPKA